MDICDLLDLSSNLAHNPGATEGLGAATTAKHERIGSSFSRSISSGGPCSATAWQQPPLDDLTRVLLSVLPEPCKGVPELHRALLDRVIVLSFILLPNLEPFFGVLGLVTPGPVFDGEVFFYKLQPDLARLAFNLWGVEFDAAKLVGILNPEENVPDVFVGEVVADAF